MTTTMQARLDAPARGAHFILDRLWSPRWLGAAAAIGLAALFGLVSGLATPRGPVTTQHALVAIVVAGAVGVVAGMCSGSRWQVLWAPLAFVAVFELVRIEAVGPTVDGPNVSSMIGLLPFLLARVWHGLLVPLPMAIGVLYGVALAAVNGHPRATAPGRAGWVVTAGLTMVVLAVVAGLLRPATTAPIVGDDGEPLPDSVAELVLVDIGGHRQALMIRGASVDNPVLLHLAGGPGGTDIGAMRLDERLEEDFIVATWDQRGTGKSYPAFDPASTLTLEQVVADTIEVSDYLRDRFGQDRIVLAGQSWGTIPAVLAAQRHPDAYLAVVSTGQMVDVRETDELFYDDTLAWARETGRDGLVSRLEAMGPPPYEDVVTDYPVLVGAERELNPYPEFDGSTEMPATVWVRENSLMDQVNAFRGLADTYSQLYPQLQDLDLRRTVGELEVPIVVVMGEHEARGRVEPAREWFDQLQAPDKAWTTFEASSHRANFERPGDYVELLNRVVVAAS